MTQSVTQRYLELLKASLLNLLYIENELRLLYVSAMVVSRQSVDLDVLRAVQQRLPDWLAHVQAARADGRPWWFYDLPVNGVTQRLNLRNSCEFSHTMVGRQRLDSLEQCLDHVRLDRIPGDVIETGVWRGGAAIFLRGYLAAHEMQDRKVWVADSFEGLPKPTLPQDAGYDFSPAKMPILAVSLDEVKENFRRYGLLDERVRFLKGWFKDTLRQAPIDKLALARLDGDLYESTMDALNALYHRIEPGGFLIVDDYGDFEPCRRAVDEFRRRFGIVAPLQTIDWTGVYWRKP